MVVVSPVEAERRERYVREYTRPRTLLDPFTWPYRYKGAGAFGGAYLIVTHLYNKWNKKPWYYAIYPRVISLAVVSLVGFGAGSLREYHCRTRDAVVEHYVSLHPDDFDHLKDLHGRPYSQVLLPWYPNRTYYRKYDD